MYIFAVMDKKSFIAIFMIVFTIMLSSFAFYFWQMIYSPNILVDKPDQLVAIEKGSSFKEVQANLQMSL